MYGGIAFAVLGIVCGAVDVLVAQLVQIGAVGLKVEQTIACVAAEAELVVLASHHWPEHLEWVDKLAASLAHVTLRLLVQTRVGHGRSRGDNGGRGRGGNGQSTAYPSSQKRKRRRRRGHVLMEVLFLLLPLLNDRYIFIIISTFFCIHIYLSLCLNISKIKKF
jgi:hypothetical protein